MRPRRPAGQVGFYLLVAVFVVVSLLPFVWIAATSLKTDAEIARGVHGFVPAHPTWAAYRSVFEESDFVRPLLNSALVALVATAISVVFGALAGYALARLPIPGRQVVLGFLLVAGFFPIIAMIGPLFLLYRRIGLLDSYTGVIISYLVYTVPIATWLLANYFSQIPRELEEAALVDGATRLQALRLVVAPVALPGLFTAAILSFILAWNDFPFALSFLQSPGKFTAPLAIVNLGQSQFQVFYNRIDAGVVVITLPVALLVLFAQRRIISGLTAGALK